MHSHLFPSVLLPVLAYATPLTLRSDSSNPVLTSSFTWNDKCGATVACGPAMAGVHGQGTTAANNVTFAAGKPIVSGKGAGCGQCWHLQATADPFPQNGKTWGTPVVAIINDQCTDGGYCDQTESRPLNTGYGKQVHFDLCGETGTAQQFFGALGMGVLTGYAQQVDCSMLSKGTQGSGAGNLVAPKGGGSPSATWKHAADGPAATSNVAAAADGLAATSSIPSAGNGAAATSSTPSAGNGAAATSSTASAATSDPKLSPWSNSTISQQSSGQSTGGQTNGGQSSGGQSSGGQSSGGQNGGQGDGGQGSGGQSGIGGSVNSGGNTQPSNPGTQPQQQHVPSVQSGSQAPPTNQQTTPENPQKATKPQQQQQQQQVTTGHSHGSMKGLEDAAFKAAPGGVDSMKQAMEKYMQEALAGDAPDDDGEEGEEEDDECSEE